MVKSEKHAMNRWMRRLRDGECGQAMIEAAVAAPILFVLLMGAGEIARVAYMAIEVANAARAGAAYAALSANTIGDTNGTVLAAKDDAYDIYKVSGLTTTKSTPGYICSDGSAATVAAGALPTCPNGDQGAHPLEYVTVTSKANFDPLIHIPGLPTTFTLSSSATELCLDCG